MIGSEGPRKGRGSWLVNLLLPAFLTQRERAEFLSDLEELRVHRTRLRGRLQASLWFWFELVRGALVFRLNRSAFFAPWRRGEMGAGSADVAGFMESVLRDLRVAARSFVRTPGVSLVAVATIALGIGATTAIFSFADALLLKPLPVRDSGRLVSLLHNSTTSPNGYSSFSFPDFEELRERNEVLSDLGAFAPTQLRLGQGQGSEMAEGMIVSGNYFSTLGAEMMAGRGFVAEEDRTPGTHPVVVLSYGLWERRYGGDLSIVGRDVTVNGSPFTVVGITSRDAPSLDLRSDPRLWVPLQMHEVILPGFSYRGVSMFGNRGTHWLRLFGRLREGVSRAEAQRSLQSIAAWQAESYPETNGSWTVSLSPVGEARAGWPGQRPLVQATALLAVVVALVLLIVCANVANILLSRSIARSGEMGVRLAVGAGRLRLIRQVLTEALLLSLFGGLCGLALAVGAMRLIPLLGVTDGYPGLHVSLDLRVLLFASGLSLLTGTAFGLIPALRASGEGLVRWRRGGGGPGGDGRRISFRQAMLALQVGFSLVLLIGAGLALRTLWNLRTLPFGFEMENVQVASIDLAEGGGGLEGGYSPEDGQRFHRRLLDQLRALPGVEAAGLSRLSPFSTRRMANDVLWEEGGGEGGLSRINVDMNAVGEGYFRTVRIPVVRGRPFTPNDRLGSPDVVVVEEGTAARLWPGLDPLGRRLWLGTREGAGRELEVVGVVADGRYHRKWRSEGPLFLFLPLAQHHAERVHLHVRGSAESLPSIEAIRRIAAELDPALPPLEVRPGRTLMAEAMAMERTNAKLLGLFGLLALVISAIGVYGVVSFWVRRRTHEIGVRMALGARPLDVRRIVVMGCAAPILAGTVLGWLTAWGLGRFAAAFLFDIQPSDPLTFGAMGALLVAVGFLAAFVPAHRATRVNPFLALREE